MSVTPSGPTIHIEPAGPLPLMQGSQRPTASPHADDALVECGYDSYCCCACLLVVWRAVCDFICCLFCGCCAQPEPAAPEEPVDPEIQRALERSLIETQRSPAERDAEQREIEERILKMSIDAEAQRQRFTQARATSQADYEEQLKLAEEVSRQQGGPTTIFKSPQHLIACAAHYFNGLQKSIFTRLDFSKTPCETLKELVTALLTDYEGVAVGEYHNHSSPKYFLWLFMDLFVARGVTTLYVEGYTSEGNWQAEFNAYFNAPKDSPMSDKLKAKLSSYRKMHKSGDNYYSELMVIERAKQAGIRRVIIIDHDDAYSSDYDQNKMGTRIDRLMAMNYYAKCMIDATRDRGKYVIWAGSGHTRYGGIVPPLGQLFRIPTLDFSDEGSEVSASQSNQPQPKIHRAREIRWTATGNPNKTDEITYSDFYIEMPPPVVAKKEEKKEEKKR